MNHSRIAARVKLSITNSYASVHDFAPCPISALNSIIQPWIRTSTWLDDMPSKQVRILLVDDSPVERLALGHYLRRARLHGR